MKYLFGKLKSMPVAIMALSFLVAVTLSSCGGKKQSTEDEATGAPQEQVDSTATEHPSGDEEAPADSTATEDEHPSGEHPSGE